MSISTVKSESEVICSYKCFVSYFYMTLTPFKYEMTLSCVKGLSLDLQYNLVIVTIVHLNLECVKS